MGKTIYSSGLASRHAKHPHACGEDSMSGWSRFDRSETPPRLWGRPRTARLVARRYGNTPTPVGKTPYPYPYPYLVQETPPRLWGRPDSLRHPPDLCGNTPTPVGKTDTLDSIEFFSQKHPHACGEDALWNASTNLWKETPPRLWGRPGGWVHGLAPLGKHPHACGEDQSQRIAGLAGVETPPRLWGRHATTPQGNLAARNTPTPVGKTKEQGH